MKMQINIKNHEIHLLLILLTLLTLTFSFFALYNYLQAKNITKNGKKVIGVVTEIFCTRKKKNNGTVILQLPSVNISKKLKTNNCTFINVGDTIMVQFLSVSDGILEYRNGKILSGRYFYSTLLGFLASILIFFIGIKKRKSNYLS
jgi:hypothetical protein